VTRSTGRWRGLDPEMERWMPPTTGRRVAAVTHRALVMALGGYQGPRWISDHRPQPLRSRSTVQHFRTLLRREAVSRLRMKGESFRAIGRELGISQVAVWKLWKQTMDDLIDQSHAERKGRRLLAEAYRRMQEGDAEHFRVLFRCAVRRFGVRAATRLLGRLE
jgi:hypothetical protein